MGIMTHFVVVVCVWGVGGRAASQGTIKDTVQWPTGEPFICGLCGSSALLFMQAELYL